MIDHVSIAVRDLKAAEAFYTALLAPEFWINRRANKAAAGDDSGAHVCLRATSTKAVDAFHAAAIAHGGASDGAPGLRPEYNDRYYAAFVSDADGNRIEAVTFTDGK
jgi:catechol 2,3-dioxygenase-like lactoylglutathione lyase family enzyme